MLSCVRFCDPMGCSPPGSSVHEIFQARILEWVAISFSRGSTWPRYWTRVSHTIGRCFTVWATREAWVRCAQIYAIERELWRRIEARLRGQSSKERPVRKIGDESLTWDMTGGWRLERLPREVFLLWSLIIGSYLFFFPPQLFLFWPQPQRDGKNQNGKMFFHTCAVVSHSVVSDSLWPPGL